MIAIHGLIENDLARANSEEERLTSSYDEKLADLLDDLVFVGKDYLVLELPDKLHLDPEDEREQREAKAQASEEDTQKICSAVECTYRLWQDKKRRKLFEESSVYYYGVSRSQASARLAAVLDSGDERMNGFKLPYTIATREVEIPEDIALYLRKHPEVQLNLTSAMVHEELRRRIRNEKEVTLSPETPTGPLQSVDVKKRIEEA